MYKTVAGRRLRMYIHVGFHLHEETGKISKKVLMVDCCPEMEERQDIRGMGMEGKLVIVCVCVCVCAHMHTPRGKWREMR